MIKSQNFKEKYEAAKEGWFETFKNFVIKCLLAICYSLKVIFSLGSINEAKKQWRQVFKSEKLSGFKKYLSDNLDRREGEGFNNYLKENRDRIFGRSK